MQRAFLQNPILLETLQQIRAWHGQLKKKSLGGESVLTIVDGALLGAQGMQQLCTAYGAPNYAFDGTPLDLYEELGLLIWPWVAMDAHDEAESLRTTMAERPGVSFVRVNGENASELGHRLAWLAGARTDDGMQIYLRAGDTRVLASFLRHMRPIQRAHLQTVVREWVWPDREGRAQSKVIESAEMLPEPESPLILDDAQYASLLDDAATDIFHAALRPIESGWHDPRSGAELHAWLQRVLQRTATLGITRQQDQMAFTSLALRVPGDFESALELGETWLRVRSGAAILPDEVERWTASQWAAVERYSHA